MKINDIVESTNSKLAGAPPGIKIMTPQQFVASTGDMPAEEGVTEGSGEPSWYKNRLTKPVWSYRTPRGSKIVVYKKPGGYGASMIKPNGEEQSIDYVDIGGRALGSTFGSVENAVYQIYNSLKRTPSNMRVDVPDDFVAKGYVQQGVAEGQEHLDRIRSLSGLGEAIKLDAPYREFGGQEFQDYLTRIKGTPKIDNKTGQVKVGKSKISKKTGEVIPGKEQYVSGKLKKDKYTMPYIHRSSVITYLGPDGKTFSEDKIIAALKQRPVALLKQNEKMKHSNNEFEQFFNMGFAALTGIAVDESTNKLIIVNTCPGAGSCQVDCFMLAGGKIQFAGPWLSDGRNLTFILNDPEGYFKKMSDEIAKELRDGQKGSKKFPTGWQVSIRWHDAGDFFSKDYLDMTLKLAQQFPDVKFYAYTKMANAAMSKKLPNFIINWSEGAKSAQAKQVKAQDPNLERTKNSRIVPQDMFWDLLKKDEKGNLDKEGADAEGEGGRWVTRDPAATNELKQRLAKEYRISVNSILNYDEYLAKRKSIPQGMTYNVIVAPGEGDISAADRGVLSTLLLKHGNA